MFLKRPAQKSPINSLSDYNPLVKFIFPSSDYTSQHC